jgi:hypothetical protein
MNYGEIKRQYQEVKHLKEVMSEIITLSEQGVFTSKELQKFNHRCDQLLGRRPVKKRARILRLSSYQMRKKEQKERMGMSS